MIGKKGEEAIPCKYDWVDVIGGNDLYKYFVGTRTFNNENHEYDYDGKYGLIKTGGEKLTPAEFSEIEEMSYGYVLMKNFEGKKGIYDDSGKMIIPCKFDDIENYNVNFYTNPDDMGTDYWLVFIGTTENYKKQGKYGLYTESGNALTKTEYEKVSPLYKGGFKVMNNGKWAVLNTDGELITDYIYDNIDDGGFKNGRLLVFKGTKKSDEYEDVSYDGLFGYLDETGKEIIPLKYGEAYPFYDGKAEVMINGNLIIIDVDGKEIK